MWCTLVYLTTDVKGMGYVVYLTTDVKGMGFVVYLSISHYKCEGYGVCGVPHYRCCTSLQMWRKRSGYGVCVVPLVQSQMVCENSAKLQSPLCKSVFGKASYKLCPL